MFFDYDLSGVPTVSIEEAWSEYIDLATRYRLLTYTRSYTSSFYGTTRFEKLTTAQKRATIENCRPALLAAELFLSSESSNAEFHS
ncbi:hypothetical protein [Breoghania sp.]|uniref:hypothetical protein n=1 Tax=Breoghania sp. TaxID=2065378 RepID=UPI002AAA94D7|nr:hypothetical protein [Breoghania sp.]